MRRRRRRPHYAGGSGICGCCNYWNQDEEEVAQEFIKRRAKGSFAGKLICCECNRGYDRHNVKRLYILTGILFGLLIIITMSYSASVYTPAQHPSTFKKTDCRVMEIVYNKSLTEQCHWKSGQNNRGWRKYRCLRVIVSFKRNDEMNGTRTMVRAILADGYYRTLQTESRKHELQCTTKPRNCSKTGNVEWNSDMMYRYYTDVIGDATFVCFYNPEDTDQVIPSEVFYLSKAKSYVVLLGFATTLFGLLLVFMCCSCGCQYVCASRVPSEITQEVQKRRTENQGLTAGDLSAGGGNVIYVGRPMQMIPATGYQPPPMAGPQPLPMQPGQPPMGPQYGQYPPPVTAPQPGYPAPQPGYPAPQSGYGPPPPGYGPPPQPGYGPPAPGYGPPAPMQGQYPPQGGTYPPPSQAGPRMAPPGYVPSGPPHPGRASAPPAPAPNAAPYDLSTGGAYQPPTYTGMSGEAGALPPKPPMH